MLIVLLRLLSAASPGPEDNGYCPEPSNSTTCFWCLAHNEDQKHYPHANCYFCFDDKSCRSPNNITETCQQSTNTKNEQCMEELGGDAKKTVRLAVGFSVMAVGIIVDATIRFLAWRTRKDQYSHL
jgi:hypothetical protein